MHPHQEPMIPWNDPILNVRSDPPWRARYRRLQSWYRQTVLNVPPGKDAEGRPLGNLLPDDPALLQRGLNFLDPQIADYVEARVPAIRASNGTLNEDRLRRNMLSSMPLCFNLFGCLRLHRPAAARVLATALSMDIAEVESIEVECAPRPLEHLRDRTAFDAFVVYRSSAGKLAFLGIETKYTETFSQHEYDAAQYAELTDRSTEVFKPGAATRLTGRNTNQLWRNALLALSLRTSPGGASSGEGHSEPYAEGRIVVLACEGDRGARQAVEGLRAELREPDALVQAASLEAIVERALAEPLLNDWANKFRQRYLDLTPLKPAPLKGTT